MAQHTKHTKQVDRSSQLNEIETDDTLTLLNSTFIVKMRVNLSNTHKTVVLSPEPKQEPKREPKQEPRREPRREPKRQSKFCGKNNKKTIADSQQSWRSNYAGVKQPTPTKSIWVSPQLELIKSSDAIIVEKPTPTKSIWVSPRLELIKSSDAVIVEQPRLIEIKKVIPSSKDSEILKNQIKEYLEWYEIDDDTEFVNKCHQAYDSILDRIADKLNGKMICVTDFRFNSYGLYFEEVVLHSLSLEFNRREFILQWHQVVVEKTVRYALFVKLS